MSAYIAIREEVISDESKKAIIFIFEKFFLPWRNFWLLGSLYYSPTSLYPSMLLSLYDMCVLCVLHECLYSHKGRGHTRGEQKSHNFYFANFSSHGANFGC